MNCTGYPREADETYFEGEVLPHVIHINKVERTCLVKVKGKSVVAHLPKLINEAIQLLDFVKIKKSPVTGEYHVTDYYVNEDFYNDDYYQEVLV